MTRTTSQVSGAAALILLVVAVMASVHIWRDNHSPEHTLEVLFDQIKTSQDVSNDSDYLTPTGSMIYLKYVQKAESAKPFTKTIVSKEVQGDKCTFQASTTNPDGEPMVADFILIHEDSCWKFDDIWVESINGKEANMMMSFIIAHPYQAALTMVWQNPQMGVACAEELLGGVRAAYEIGQIVASIVTLF